MGLSEIGRNPTSGLQLAIASYIGVRVIPNYIPNLNCTPS